MRARLLGQQVNAGLRLYRHTLGELVYATIGWVHLGMDRTCMPIVAEVPA